MQIEFPNIEGNGQIFLDVMRSICGDTSNKSLLDLCAHKAPYTSQLGFKERMYVDIQKRPLDNKDEQRFFIKDDIVHFLLKNEFGSKRVWSVITLLDGIEHFKKRSGLNIAVLMNHFSETSIIFTPLGELSVEENNDHPDAHKSGWYPKDFPGYAAIVFPNFHKQLSAGAFFVWRCSDIEQDFERVKNELNQYAWTK